jgi:hypothetical protein
MTKSSGLPTNNKFDAAKKWVAGLTGVLVVIPSLVNAAVDIYSSFEKLPKTESERINVELFKKYFNKQPVTVLPVPIKRSNGTVEVRFSIYEEGDVYVEFGRFTQWFPFPDDSETKHASLSVVAQAFAAPVIKGIDNSLRGIGNYKQADRFVGTTLLRERNFQNGVTEQYRLDSLTGKILESSASPTLNPETIRGLPPVVLTIPTINLDAVRANPPAAMPCSGHLVLAAC